jgi:P-type Mg2+ transporter
MLVIGPVSSLFDFLTFYVLLKVLDAHESLFQTGWFVESLATQILVIFVIRSRFMPFSRKSSRPSIVLIGVALVIIGMAVVLPFTPLGTYFGFVPLPAIFFAVLTGMVIAYLLLVQLTKYLFYRFGTTSDASFNRV